ncbi:MAG: DUF2914 domain-containing protein [Nitrospiraceae bacterium]|nr:MAG: DUF2914 domain-containing protein [Nitrospiraceae bacterium]
MKKYSVCLLSMILLTVFPAVMHAATEMQEAAEENTAAGMQEIAEETDTAAMQDNAEESVPGFSVTRMLIAGSVENREPVGVVSVYAASTEKVYCFLEAIDITEDTEVSFVWYHEDREMAVVTLPLKKGPKWRTYSSKKLGGLTGTWKVELHDASGNSILEVDFTVE